jgi:LysR family transcriptional regulator, glycine cleavage system transcriptional activator
MKRPITSLPALGCFRAASEFESFSKAAESLNLTHGAVSRAVRLLEDDLGTPLFERRNRAVFLTDVGRRMALAVSQGLGQIEETAQSIREEQGSLPVTVSCEPTLMMRWLIPRMPEFHARYPDIDIRLTAGGGPVVLGTGTDLAIRRNDFHWPDTYTTQHLFDEKIGPVCRPDTANIWFSGGKIAMSATLLHTRTRLDAWDTWRKLSGHERHSGAAQIFEHFYFSLQAAIAGLGVAIGPWHLVRDDLQTGLLVAPNGFIADETGYYLLSQRPLATGTHMAAFRDWLEIISDA